MDVVCDVDKVEHGNKIMGLAIKVLEGKLLEAWDTIHRGPRPSDVQACWHQGQLRCFHGAMNYLQTAGQETAKDSTVAEGGELKSL
jgi:hypothetical protein